jgi:sigma-E factor negative regulatory protein RseA
MNDTKTTDQSADLINEQVSALMDGELPRDQLRFLMRRFETDAQLTQRWSRYQLMRGVIRHQVAAPLRVDFTQVVMQRLAAEAVPAARRGGAVLRWVGGGAIAATVAVAALVMTRPGLQGPAASTLAATAMPTAIQDTRTVTPVSVPTMLNFDYAQPASFETSPYGMPGYDLPRRRYEPIETGSNGIPYVLLTAPLLPPRAPEHKPAETPQQ